MARPCNKWKDAVGERSDEWLSMPGATAELLAALPPGRYFDPFHGEHITRAMRALGYDYVAAPGNFFDEAWPEDRLLVSNVPFSQTRAIISLLHARGRPFVLLFSADRLTRLWFRALFANDPALKVLIPSHAMHHGRLIDGGTRVEYPGPSPSPSIWCAWRVGLPAMITWLQPAATTVATHLPSVWRRVPVEEATRRQYEADERVPP